MKLIIEMEITFDVLQNCASEKLNRAWLKGEPQVE